MTAQAEPIAAVEQSFTGSDKHSLNGFKLHPWTPDRIIAAQSMGMLYPSLGKQDWAQYRKTKVYAGALKDVMIFVFLSTVESESIDAATWQDAKKYGTEHGLHNADSDIFWQAYNKFIEVNNEILAATTKPKGDDEDLEGND